MGDRPKAQFWVLVAGATLYFTAQGMLFPVLPLYIKRELGGDGFDIGVVVSSFALGAMFARPWGGAFSDRVGRRAVAAAGALIWTAMVLCYAPLASAFGVAGLAVARALGGLGSGAFFVAMATMAVELAPSDRRVGAFGFFSSSTLIGFALGPAVGVAVLDDRRYGITFVVVALLALGPPLSMLLLPDTRPAQIPVRTRPAMFHPAVRKPGAALLLGSLGFITFSAFVPIYAEEVGLRRVAIPLTLTAGVNLVVRLAASRAVDGVDKRQLALVSVALAVASASILAAWAAPAGIIVAAIVNGAASSYMYAGFLAMSIAKVAEAERARVIGSLTVFSDLATSVGGAAMGAVASATETRGAFVASACMGLVSLTMIARWRSPTRVGEEVA